MIIEPNETNTATFYQLVGEEQGVKNLVDEFYNLMDTLPEAKDTRDLHAKSLKGSRMKLFKFLSGWMGGPQLYIEVYGHPRLRRRHMPFDIGDKERDQWMLCMNTAMTNLHYEDGLQNQLSKLFFNTADFMKNQQPVKP